MWADIVPNLRKTASSFSFSLRSTLKILVISHLVRQFCLVSCNISIHRKFISLMLIKSSKKESLKVGCWYSYIVKNVVYITEHEGGLSSERHLSFE